jgi:hypothetical protein
MNNFETQLRDIARTTHLAADAKARMRERVMTYTQYKPVRQSFAVDYTFVYTHVYRFASAALVVALIVGGAGTAYASQDALPGDALYALKEATESVRSQITLDSESRTAWDIERANRRLQEARALAVRNALSPEREHYLAQQFETLTHSAETRIDTIHTTDPAVAQALSIELEAGIEAHERTLRVALAPAPTVAVMRAAKQIEVNTDSQDEHPLLVAIAQARTGSLHEVEEEDAEPNIVAARTVVSPPAPTLSVEPLKRAVARQEARLQKESRDAQESSARSDVQATLSAIAHVEEHIEKSGSNTQSDTDEEQEKREDNKGSGDERAFLEAALYEVHDARVRVQEEKERVREDVLEIRSPESIDDKK